MNRRQATREAKPIKCWLPKKRKKKKKKIYKNKTYNKYNKTLNYTKHITLVIVDKTELLQTRQGAYHPVGSTINHHCTEK